MATVFAPPTDIIGEPPGWDDFSHVEDRHERMRLRLEAEEAWTEKLAQWCRDNSTSDIAGEVIRIPWADGSANYMVWTTKPVQLIHIPLGDAWDVPEYMTRGLRAADLREMVERDRKLASWFGG